MYKLITGVCVLVAMAGQAIAQGDGFAVIEVPYPDRPTHYRITCDDNPQDIKLDDVSGGVDVTETVGGEQRVTRMDNPTYIVVQLRGGDDHLEINSAVQNRIRGDNGDDTILGGPGKDRIFGGRGNDFIDGRDGDDALIGEHDDDTLIGGAGRDYIYDVFGENTIDAIDGERDSVRHNSESSVMADDEDYVRDVGKTMRRRR